MQEGVTAPVRGWEYVFETDKEKKMNFRANHVVF